MVSVIVEASSRPSDVTRTNIWLPSVASESPCGDEPLLFGGVDILTILLIVHHIFNFSIILDEDNLIRELEKNNRFYFKRNFY